MVCGKCGYNNGDDFKFCQGCGNPLIIQEDNNTVVNQEVQQPVQPTQPVQQPVQQPLQPIQPQVQVAQPMQPIQGQPYYNNQMNMVPNPPKKKTGLIVLLILLFVVIIGAGIFLGAIFLGANKKPDEDNKPNVALKTDKGKRTLLIYMIGSNLESEYGEATEDIAEMINSGFDSDALDIIVYTGGSTVWKNTEVAKDENAIFKLTSDGLEKLKTYSKKNMTLASTLTEFIDYVYDNYESDLYDLLLWDHGGGPIYGYGMDEYYPDSMLSISDLNEALDNSKLLKKTKFEWIGFDACLMGSVEIANVLKEEANYFIASEEIIPGYGWNYSFLKEVSKDISTESLGKEIVKYYSDYYDDLNSSTKIYSLFGYNLYQNYSLALIDLSKIDGLIKEIDDSFVDLSSDVPASTFNLLALNTSKTTVYGCFSDEVCYNLVDLYGLADGISGQIKNASKLQTAIKKAVVYQKSNIKGTNGISIYLPIRNKESASLLNDNYEKLNFSSNYSKFIKSYTSISSADKFVKTNTKSIMPSVVTDTLSVNLEQDLADNYLKGDFSIFVKNEHGGYFPVYRGYDVKLDGNTLSTTPVKKELVITNGKGDEVSFIMSFEYDKDETSTTYIVMAALENIDLDDFRVEPVYFFVKFENGSNEGTIVDIKARNNDGGFSKNTYNLNNWTHIASMSSSYQLDDNEGNALQTWTTSSTIYGYEYDIKKDGFKFMLRDFDSKQKYYYVFRMEDTQGVKHVFKKIQAK